MNNLYRSVFIPILLWLCFGAVGRAEDGYDLWLRYHEVAARAIRDRYRQQITSIIVAGHSKTLDAARQELSRGLEGLLGQKVAVLDSISDNGAVVVGTPKSSSAIARLGLEERLHKVGGEGFIIQTVRVEGRLCTVIAAEKELGVLYGAFHLLRLLQTQQDISTLEIASAPKIQRRVLDHWDLLSGSAENDYAGMSIWKWSELPDKIDPRMVDYARANASLGINGTVLNSVNTDPQRNHGAQMLSEEYLRKAAALAEVFRPFGIRVYLSARFTAPMEYGGLPTADPLDARVIAYWHAKADEIYRLIPDFGGFLVKANSEGQPGPQDYGRTHADGANVMARALAPHGGIVMWRAFVYGKPTEKNLDPDRMKQSYQAFAPLDGQFDSNVLLQVKTGPFDFLPREPVHPLFGAMSRTPLMLEVQISQEYAGESKYLVYLAPTWKEVLDFDTYSKGKGSTVAKVVDGSLDGHRLSGIAGVRNIGSDRNWCGHHFAQANWYSFGRLTWDHTLEPKAIAEEWARMTFSNDRPIVDAVVSMMMKSREIAVDTMVPLGLPVLHAMDHYRPEPEKRTWYHKADAYGVGFDRSRTGSDAVDQYPKPYSDLLNDPTTCPEKYLLWFHHVSWDAKMKSGRTLWDELCHRYASGVEGVKQLRETWESLRGKIDEERFLDVEAKLKIQEKDSEVWRDTCVKYFESFSQRPIPNG